MTTGSMHTGTGGFVIYRAVLCHCGCAGSSSSSSNVETPKTASSSTGTPQSVVSPTTTETPTASPNGLDAQRSPSHAHTQQPPTQTTPNAILRQHDRAGAVGSAATNGSGLSAPSPLTGTIDLLTEAELALVGASPMFRTDMPAGKLVPRHKSPHCRFVLVKTTHAIHTQAEQMARLRYEEIMHTKLCLVAQQDAEAYARNNDNSRRATGGSTTQQQLQNNGSNSSDDESSDPKDALVPQRHLNLSSFITAEAESAALFFASSIVPHLRHLPDSRPALVISDPGGLTLQHLINTNAFQTTPTSVPTPSAAVASASSQALAPTPTAAKPLQPSATTLAASAAAAAASSVPLISISSVQSALRVALCIARPLLVLHRHSFIHKALHPATLCLHPVTGDVQFLDLGAASILVKNRTEPEQGLHLQQSDWVYAAPELSGKANRVIDSRSDLYSLGVILFKLLTSRAPFQSADPLELIHSHLAKQVPSIIPRYVTPTTQPFLHALLTVVQQLLTKLLSKQAEDRYQSAAGLIHDLSELLSLIGARAREIASSSAQTVNQAMSFTNHAKDNAGGSAAGSTSTTTSTAVAAPVLPGPDIGLVALQQFQIGRLDLYSTFRISQRLYGREDEVKQLIARFHQVCGGVGSPDNFLSVPKGASSNAGAISTTQLCLVSGYSGVGKCWAPGTKMLLYSGEIQLVEAIRDGDLLAGDDGTPRRVVPGSVITGVATMYRIEHPGSADEDEAWEVNGDHILVLTLNQRPCVETLANGHHEVRFWTLEPGTTFPVLRTIAYHSAREAESHCARLSRSWTPLVFECTVEQLQVECPSSLLAALQMYRPAMVHFQPPTRSLRARLEETFKHEISTADVAEAAWAIGAYLADESTRSNRPVAVAAIEKFASRMAGESVSARTRYGTSFQRLVASYHDDTQSGGVSLELMRESPIVRRALLAGILEGGGRLARQQQAAYEFFAPERALVDSTIKLARTLGLTARVQSTEDKHCVTLAGADLALLAPHLHYLPAIASRNAAVAEVDRHAERSIAFKISQIERGTYHGFTLSTVDGRACNGRLLLANFLVTHNTVLVDELHKHIVRTHGLFARGKFDLYKSDSSCLLQAFRHLILALTVQDALRWKVKLLRALGVNAGVIAALIPELGRLLGDLPPVTQLPTAETAARFQQVFVQFVTTLASPATPLTLFIDDLQWADSGSLALIHLLVSQSESAHLLVIGAYRSNEVDATHPLALLIEKLRESHPERVGEVKLKPLSTYHIQQLLIDSFRCSEAEAAPFANMLASQTQGNPFFLSTLLKSYYNANLLRFDFNLSKWVWSVDGMWRTDAGEDVVDVLLQQMLSLNLASQRVLQLAACIGNTFTLHALHLITQMDLTTLVRCVLNLEQSGMLTCTSHAHDLVLLAEGEDATGSGPTGRKKKTASQKSSMALLALPPGATSMAGTSIASTPEESPADASVVPLTDEVAALETSPTTTTITTTTTVVSTVTPLDNVTSDAMDTSLDADDAPEPSEASTSSLTNILLKFVHDKVQTAAYRLIPPHELSLVHCTIAHQLLHHLTADECEEYAMDLTSHVNVGYLELPEVGNNFGTSASAGNSPDQLPRPIEAHAVPRTTETLAMRELTQAKWHELFNVPGMIDRIIELELIAGKQAMGAAAYSSAIRLFESALKLVQWKRGELRTPNPSPGSAPRALEVASTDTTNNSTDGQTQQTQQQQQRVLVTVSAGCWSASYSTCLRAYQALAQCFFLSADYTAAQETLEYTLSHVTEVIDRATLFDLHIQTLNQQSRMQEALDIGLGHLKELGIDLLVELPPELKAWIFNFPDVHDESTFNQHPVFACEPMGNPIVMTLLTGLCPALFFLASPLFYNTVITVLYLTMTRGVTPETAYGLATFAMCCWPQHTMMDEVYALGRIARMLLEIYGEQGKFILSRTNTAVLGAVYPWKKPLRECLVLLEIAFDEAIGNGDLEWAGYLGMYLVDMSAMCGMSLSQALSKQRATMAVCQRKKHPMAQPNIQSWIDITEALMGVKDAEPLLVPITLPPDTMTYRQVNVHMARGILAIALGRFHVAVDEFTSSKEALQSCGSLCVSIPFVYWSAIAHLGACPIGLIPSGVLATDPSFSLKPTLPVEYSPTVVLAHLAEVDRLLGKLHVWAASAPRSFQHRLCLVLAERAKVCILSHLACAEQLAQCMALYDGAIEGARQEQYLYEEGFACERAAMFYAAIGRFTFAASFRAKAFDAYTIAGSALKLRQLVARFPQDGFDLNSALSNIAASAAALSSQNGRNGGQSTSAHAQHLSQQQLAMQAAGVAGSTTSSSVPTQASASGFPNNLPHSPSSDFDQASTSTNSYIGVTNLSSNSSTSSRISGSSMSAKDPAFYISPLTSGGQSASAQSDKQSLSSSPSVTGTSIGVTSSSSTSHVNLHTGTSGGTSLSSGHRMGANPAATTQGQQNLAEGGGVSFSPLGGGGNRSSDTLDGLSVLKATASFSTEKDQKQLLKRLMTIVLETAGATRGVLVLQDDKGDWCIELGASVEVEEEDNANERTSDEKEGTDAKVKEEEADEKMGEQPEAVSDLGSLSNFTTNTDHLLPPPTYDVNNEAGSQWSSSSSSTGSSGTIITSGGGRLRVGSASLSVLTAIPASVFQFVLSSVETVVLAAPHDLSPFSPFGQDPYFRDETKHHPKACLCMPVLKAGAVFGVLYIENDYDSGAFTSSHIQLLQLLCSQAALSIDNARLYSQLSVSNLHLHQLLLQRTSELETLQVAMDAAEKAMRIKSEFLSNMSHEIRTPLNAVLGLGQLLAETTSLSMEQQQYINMISNSGQLLLTIINDILDLSKIEAGQLLLNLTPCNIVDVVENAMMLCYEMATSKGLIVGCYVDPKIPPRLLLDSSRLQQILLNLMSNSIKFTHTGSVEVCVTGRWVQQSAHARNTSHVVTTNLTLPAAQCSGTSDNQGMSIVLTEVPHDAAKDAEAVSNIETLSVPSSSMSNVPAVSTSDEGAGATKSFELEFMVRDTGIGISEDQLKLLFRAFSQVHHMSGEYGGTGLGLVISKRLVQAMGSTGIIVESALGAGSTFRFSFATEVDTSSNTPEASPNQLRRVLQRHQAGGDETNTSLLRLPPGEDPTQTSPSAGGARRNGSGSNLNTGLAPSPRFRLHGLAAVDVDRLAASRVLYIGEQHAAAHMWIRLLKRFGMAVTAACLTVEEAAKAFLAAAGQSEEERRAAVAQTFVLVDLDSRQVHQETAIEQLAELSLCKLLFLYSKGHMAALESSEMISHATNVAQHHAAEAEAEAQAAQQQEQQQQQQQQETATTTAAEDAGADTASAPPSASSPSQLGVPSADSTTGESLNTTGSPSTSSASVETTNLYLTPLTISRTVMSPALAAAFARTVRRTLKKPFKAAAFLDAIVGLLKEPLPQPSARPLTTHDTTAASPDPIASPQPSTATSAAPSSAGGHLAIDTSSATLAADGQHQSATDRSTGQRSTPGSASPMHSPHLRPQSMTPRSGLALSSHATTQSSAAATASSSSLASGASMPPRSVPRPNPKALQPIAGQYPLRILLAEDNLVNQKMMVMLMRKLGYELHVACHGLAALALLEREAQRGPAHEIECILMDASMDVMDGMECTRVIRSQQMPHRIRPFVIAQTANVTEEYRRRCFAAGMDLFIAKPINIGALVDALKEAYRAHHPNGSAAAAPAPAVATTVAAAPSLANPPAPLTAGVAPSVSSVASTGAPASAPAAASSSTTSCVSAPPAVTPPGPSSTS